MSGVRSPLRESGDRYAKREDVDRHEPLSSRSSCRLVVADSCVTQMAADPPWLSSDRLSRAIFVGAAIEAAF